MITLAQRLKAVLQQKCPRCLQGKVFSGSVTMRERCPVCDHAFERESGYFTGAMYASYFLAIPVLVLLTLIISWLFLPDWPLHHVAMIAVIPFLFLVPAIFRYSRIVWMHINPPSFE